MVPGPLVGCQLCTEAWVDNPGYVLGFLTSSLNDFNNLLNQAVNFILEISL